MDWNSQSGVGTWPSRDIQTLTDAAHSNAKAVFVELGTNDAPCAGQPDPVSCQLGVAYTVKVAIDQLLGAGKCVVWAGPREIDPSTGSPAPDGNDYDVLNDFIQGYAANHPGHPGRLYYANWDQYVWSGQNSPPGSSGRALYDDLVLTTENDYGRGHIHPDTQGSMQALADYAQFWAQVCGIPAH